MQISDLPVKFPVIWASSAGAGYITEPIPVPSQIGVEPGRASFTTGFVPLNFEPVASGGIPSWGADFNGLLYQVTAWLRWAQGGGIPCTYDATFSASVGGYPKGAFLQSLTTGKFWISSADNNGNNPDTGGANWIAFPDVLIQAQAGNVANDTGAANAVVVTLSPEPASLAAIKGAPIRFWAGHATTVTAPTILIANVAGDAAVTMINTDGTALGIGQISRTGQLVEGFYDGTYFQVSSPPKAAAAGTGPFVPGCLYLSPIEVPFVGTLECNGALLLIAGYPNLFNVIKNNYGGDGVTTFKLPDYRGGFFRIWDHGRGLDLNAATRTSAPNGGGSVVGDHVGSWEQWLVGSHGHSASLNTFLDGGARSLPFPWPSSSLFNLASGGATSLLVPIGDFSASVSVNNNTGGENRPINVDVMCVIGY